MPPVTYQDEPIRTAIHTALSAAVPGVTVYDGPAEFQAYLAAFPRAFVIHTGMHPEQGQGLTNEDWTYSYRIIAEMGWPSSGTVELAESEVVDAIVTQLWTQPEPFGGVALWRHIGDVEFDEQPTDEEQGAFYRVFVGFTATVEVFD